MNGSWRVTPLPRGWYGKEGIAARVIRRDVWCQWGSIPDDGVPHDNGVPYMVCGARATECDHIGDRNDHAMVNLRGLCHNHHAKRTSTQGAMGRASIRARFPKRRPADPHPGWKAGDQD